jgi:hypothetical protein
VRFLLIAAALLAAAAVALFRVDEAENVLLTFGVMSMLGAVLCLLFAAVEHGRRRRRAHRA